MTASTLPNNAYVQREGGAAAGDAGAADEFSRERKALVQMLQHWAERTLSLQCLDESENDGAFDASENGWFDGRESAYILGRLLAIRAFSDWFDLDAEHLGNAIRRCAEFVCRRQAPDGRLDLGGYYTPNEAGFPVPAMVEGYRRLRDANDPLWADIAPLLERFVKKAAEAILHGDAYTANHRWAAASAPLAAAHSLWPDPRYLAKIESYLADGIDCDADGCWYEERSPNYNTVANYGLLVLADELNRPELIEPVIRNMRFTLATLQPNGEADTSFSHRQDRGQPNRPPCAYGIARRIAHHTGDGRFSTLALNALAQGHSVVDALMPSLYDLARHPTAMPTPRPLPAAYDVQFPTIHVARFRRGNAALTLAADGGGHFYSTVRDQWGGTKLSEDWLHLHWGDVVIESLSIAVAGMPAIQPQTLTRVETGRYQLAGSADPWIHTLHFRPGKPQIPMQGDLAHVIDVSASGDAVSVHAKVEASASLYGELRIWVRPGASVSEGDRTLSNVTAKQFVALHGGSAVTLRQGRSAIRITGLPPAAHRARVGVGQPIPTGIPDHCALLAVGLRMPTELRLNFELI